MFFSRIWFRDRKFRIWGLEIKHLKAHNFVWQGCFFLLLLSRNFGDRLISINVHRFVILCIGLCWDTASEKTGLWQVPIVSSVFKYQASVYSNFIPSWNNLLKLNGHANPVVMWCLIPHVMVKAVPLICVQSYRANAAALDHDWTFWWCVLEGNFNAILAKPVECPWLFIAVVYSTKPLLNCTFLDKSIIWGRTYLFWGVCSPPKILKKSAKKVKSEIISIMQGVIN